MKKRIKQSTALLLAASLIMTPAAHASEALGTELRNKTTTVAQGVSVTNQSLWSATYSDLRTENYLTYTPNDTVTPIVSYGSTVASVTTLKGMASLLEQQGLRVVGGVNASFFNSNGTPIGLLIKDGLIQSDGADYYAVGFFEDGSIRIGEPTVTTTATWQTKETVTTDQLGNPVTVPATTEAVTLSGINKIRADGGYYLYTDTFGTATKNTIDGVDVVLQPLETVDPITGLVETPDGLSLGQPIQCKVVTVRRSTADTSIPSGCFVLSMNINSNADSLAALSALQAGDVVTLSAVSSDPSWNDAVHVVSGMYRLVQNGAVVSGLSSAVNPYTAVGVKADGSMVLYTIDGRQSKYSIGATYQQVAKRMIELGCVDVVAMDGGGSTTFGTTYANQSALGLTNQPSGGSARSVSTCIFLVEAANAGTGVLDSFYVNAAAGDLVLAGGSVNLGVTPVDTDYYPMTYSGDLSWSAQMGTVASNQDGTFVYTANTSGTENGFDTVTVTSSDGKSGSIQLKVITQLSALTVKNQKSGAAVSSLTVTPGDTVDLTAAGTYYNMSVLSNDASYTWNADASVGTIDANGLFTAGKVNGSGKITVTGGGKTVSIPVTVTGGNPFADTNGHWSEEYVTQLYLLGITKGVQGTDGIYFYPNKTITRGELLTLVIRMLGADTAAYASVVLPFEDTASIDANWLLPYVKTAYALGIFTGAQVGDTLYANTGDSVTRETAMTMIGRTLGYSKAADLSGYTDHGAVSDWAGSYVQTLVALGVIQGSDGMLSPKSNVTRGEIAKIISVTVALPEQPDVPEEGDTTTDAEETTFLFDGVTAAEITNGTTGTVATVGDAALVNELLGYFQDAVYTKGEPGSGTGYQYLIKFYDETGTMLEQLLILDEVTVEYEGNLYTWKSGPMVDLYDLGSLFIM